jgi:hypothetical protein
LGADLVATSLRKQAMRDEAMEILADDRMQHADQPENSNINLINTSKRHRRVAKG